jgi:hypothetical protein
VCFQQLSRIVMDFDFSHGVMFLLIHCATENSGRARAADVDTCQAQTVCTRVRRISKSSYTSRAGCMLASSR